MKYFIPAWHKQYDDWSINIPSIENYDAAEYMTKLIIVIYWDYIKNCCTFAEKTI